jgi:MtrB/PioB family decaheme-associated outer membrane protein
MAMKTNIQQFGFNQTLIAVAVLATCGPAHAEDDEVAALIKPDRASVSVGAAGVSGDHRDRSLWGQYNGMREDDAYFLLDFDYLTRDDQTGTWVNLYGRNLGLDTRELGGAWNKQGDWKVSLDYSEIVKRDPRTINTFISGGGTPTPTVNTAGTPGAGTDLNLDLKRKRTTVGIDKQLGRGLQISASFRNEDKDGARLFGKGFACSAAWQNNAGVCTSATAWGLLMLPEPIDSNTKQFDVKLNFAREKLALTAGYYGSFYENSYSTLTPQIAGTLNNFNSVGGTPITDAGLLGILGLPMALPPDNQAHQFYLAGNYGFTRDTRGTFKASYAIATQDETFPAVFLADSPTRNLDGEVTNFKAHLGLTSRPLQKLYLNANVRYEDKQDNTPTAYYSELGQLAPPTPTSYTNNPSSSQRLVGKLEGTYQLPYSFSGTLGIDYEKIDRDLPVATAKPGGLNVLREQTEEISYRAELRRSISETLNGSISYVRSERDGSDWYQVTTGLVLPESSLPANQVYVSTYGDRERDKVRLTADWEPAERLALQFVADYGKDKYTSGGATTDRGLRDTDLSFYSIDATYQLADAWKLIGYVSYGDQTIHINHSTGYRLALNDRTDTVGLKLNGQWSEKLSLGAGVSYTDDKNRYQQLQTNMGLSPGVPDVVFRQTELSVFGDYALNKLSSIRVDLVHVRSKLDEFTWDCATCSPATPFTYSDGTTVSLQPDQNVTFLGARYTYKFR